jgi:hypothetical protein
MHITPNNRLASLGTIGLLFLAGIAGMVFLLPASPVHAASPTVSLSTISSGKLTAVTSGTVGSTLVIGGSGFNPNSAVTITTTIGSTTTAWLSHGTCGVTNGGVSSTTTKYDSLVATTGTNANCLVTTAKGGFYVEVVVPPFPGGAQTISVSDGVNTVTQSFTVTQSISITYTGMNYGFPTESISPSISVTGFGASETVTVATSMWTTTSFTCPTNAQGSGSCGAGTVVADQNSGTKTITATGGTSGLVATTTYTVNPWAAFYNSGAGATTFSFVGSAPTSLLIEAHGLPAGTIPANSITVGGVATSHSSVTIGSTGDFGTTSHLVVSPSGNVNFGQANVVIDGITFSYALGNIASTGVGTTVTTNYWGGVLISSIACIGSCGGTGVVSTDASSYKPGTGFTPSTTSPAPAQDQIGIFGYGFTAGNTININNAPNVTPGLGFASCAGCVTVSTAGAFFEDTTPLTDTAYSATATPTTPTTYLLTVTENTAGPANILSPSIGITPWATAPTVSSVDFTTATSITGHGFSNTETLTMKVDGTAATSGTCPTGATGTCTMSGTTPDVAGGSQSVTATGSLSGQVATAGTVTVNAIASSNGAQTILPDVGSAGTTAVLRTGSTYGIHGLLANTAYEVMWNSHTGPIMVGTFTSTSTGGIPVPGVQFTVPGDSSGVHIIDIQTISGASAFFGSTVAGDVAGTLTGYTSAYGDMLFSNTATLQTTPSVASIGSPEGISGNGLAAAQQYIVTLSSTGLCPSSSQVTQPALGSFTSTSAGGVPSGTSITLTDTPTTTETGTVENFVVQTAANFGVSLAPIAACAQFVLAASAADNMTTAPAGHSVTLNAHALNGGGAVYNVVFNYALNALGSSYTGTTVGVVAPSTTGAGTVNWTIPPGTQPGTYAVQLVLSSVGTSTLKAGSAVLNVPLEITVGSVSSTSCNNTSCIGVSGSTFTTQGVYNGISSSFTNNSNQPVTAFAYAVVHNALGQTVDISTATLTNVGAGQSATAFNVLFGLAPGTYSVTLFVTSSAGTAISSTSTVSVTIP